MSEQNNNELRQKVINFLNAHHKAVFAILDKEGLPTTSLMLYVIDDDLNVYFGSRRSFGKYADITQNPVLSLSVVQESIDPLQVVDIRGTTVEIPEGELEAVHSFFKLKNPAKYYIEDAPDFVMFKIQPSFVRWLDATSGELVITNLELPTTPRG
jgi:general stress protein 26